MSTPLPHDHTRDRRTAPVRVLILNHSVRDGGPCRSLHVNLKYFDRTVLHSTVIVPRHDLFTRLVEPDQLAAVRPDARYPESLMYARFQRRNRLTTFLSVVINLTRMFRLIAGMGRWIRETRTEVIYCNGTLAKIIGAIAGNIWRRPVVWHIRNYQTRTAARSFMAWLGCTPWVHRIVAISECAAGPYRQAAGKVVVLPNSVDPEDFRSGDAAGTAAILRHTWACGPETVVFGVCGRVVPKKGFREFLEAGRSMIGDHMDMRLVIIGSTPPFRDYDEVAALRDLVQEWRMGDRVVFTGFQPDVRRFLQALDVLVVPSKYPDPFNRTVIEGMAMGLPVIGTKIGGIQEIILSHETGLLVPAGDVDSLAQAMGDLARDGETRRTMGEAGRTRVWEYYHGQQRAKQLQEWLVEAAKDAI